jgi:hypothetical protein
MQYIVKWVETSTGEKGTVSIVFSSYEEARKFVNIQYKFDDDTVWTIECVST